MFAAFGTLWVWWRVERMRGAEKLVLGLGCYGVIPAISWLLIDRFLDPYHGRFYYWTQVCWNWTWCWEALGGFAFVWGAVQLGRSVRTGGDTFE